MYIFTEITTVLVKDERIDRTYMVSFKINIPLDVSGISVSIKMCLMNVKILMHHFRLLVAVHIHIVWIQYDFKGVSLLAFFILNTHEDLFAVSLY